ncbi:MAG: aldehyde ferredoxin oxidoreductase family protein [Candidatus Hodarchaeales archaeon]
MKFSNQLKIGIIDLTSQLVTSESVSFNSNEFTQYLGGDGFVAEYLLKNMPAGIDPLSPENYLCFITGVLSATKVPFSGRYTVVGKSPLTNTWGEANSGGRFGPELRKTGFNILIIGGKAENLSTIIVTNDKIEIKPSPQLKGLDGTETEDILKNKYGKKVQVASIGLAGENLVLISGIVTDKGRIAARSGLGAVMGSKNLKAIVARGTKSIPIANPDELNELRKLVNKRINKGLPPLMKPGLKASTVLAPWIRRFRIKNYGSMATSNMIIETYKKWGTCAGSAIMVETGDAPVKNWSGSYQDFPLKKSMEITGDNITKYQIKNYACHSCPLACGGIMSYSDERYNIEETHKPEYESLIMLGANLLNDDLGSIFELNEFCNRQGLDTIAAGSLLAYTIEAMEKGLISEREIGECKITWGDPTNYLKLLKKVINREGFGEILADGFIRAEKEIGGDFGIHIQNQALPAHDPRFSKTMIIPYRLDPSPGRHTPFTELMIDLSKFNKMFPDFEKSKRISDFYCYHQFSSSVGLCQFSLLTGNFPVLEFINLATGLNLSGKDIITIGERILTLKHLFNLREGLNPLKYSLPSRVMTSAHQGPNKEIPKKEEDDIINYFLMSLDWDTTTTKPRNNRLKLLNLEQFG